MMDFNGKTGDNKNQLLNITGNKSYQPCRLKELMPELFPHKSNL